MAKIENSNYGHNHLRETKWNAKKKYKSYLTSLFYFLVTMLNIKLFRVRIKITADIAIAGTLEMRKYVIYPRWVKYDNKPV